jgi:hypothetical protein
MDIQDFDYYEIDQISNRWKYSPDDVHDFIVSGQLASVVIDQHIKAQPLEINGAGKLISTGEAEVFIRGLFTLCHYDQIRWDGSDGCGKYCIGDITNCALRDLQGNYFRAVGEFIVDTEVIILASELHRFEAEQGMKLYQISPPHRYSESLAEQTQTVPSSGPEQTKAKNNATPPYLEPSHPFYSTELATAIMAWEHATQAFKERRGRTFKQIMEIFVSEKLNGSGFDTEGAKNRIPEVANADRFKKHIKK